MKKLFNQLSHLDNEIEKSKQVLEQVKTLPYYKVFYREVEQERDWLRAKEELNELLSKRYDLLDSIILEAEKQKGFIAFEQKDNSLLTINQI